jgi:hypothetical protein
MRSAEPDSDALESICTHEAFPPPTM